MRYNDRQSIKAVEQRFGKEVRALRVKADMSQQSLADVLSSQYGLKWHQTTLVKIEAGERPIRLIEAAAVAEFFGRPLIELIDDRAHGSNFATVFTERRRAALQEIDLMSAYLQRREQELRKEIDNGR